MWTRRRTQLLKLILIAALLGLGALLSGCHIVEINQPRFARSLEPIPVELHIQTDPNNSPLEARPILGVQLPTLAWSVQGEPVYWASGGNSGTLAYSSTLAAELNTTYGGDWWAGVGTLATWPAGTITATGVITLSDYAGGEFLTTYMVGFNDGTNHWGGQQAATTRITSQHPVRGAAVASVRDQPSLDVGPSQSLQKAEAMNMQVVYHYLGWDSIEHKPGHYDWDTVHDILKQAHAYNQSVVLRIYNPPPWRTPDGAPAGAPPANNDDLRAFMERLTSYVRSTVYRTRVAGYVIWNEPNIQQGWGGQPPDPGAYMSMLRAAYEGAKAGDPGAIVVSAPLAPTADVPDQAINDLTYLAQLYDQGLADYMDYVGMNGLGFQHTPDHDSGSADYNFMRLKYLHDVMLAKGDTTHKAWALEVGWLRDSPYPMSSFEPYKVSAEQQAQYLARAFQKAREEWPWMDLMTVWNLDFSRFYPLTSTFYWYSIADTWAEVYLSPFWSPQITSPPCGTTNDTTPAVSGVALISSTVALYVDGVAQGSSLALGGEFSQTLGLSSRPATPYTIQARVIDPGPSDLSLPVVLTVDSGYLFDPVGVSFTWDAGGGLRVLQPRDDNGCVNPAGWVLPRLPADRAVTVHVPVNTAICASSGVELTYRGQTVSGFSHSGGGLYEASFTPIASGPADFNLRVTCGATPHDYDGTVVLIDPEGVVYDAQEGVTVPISGALVSLLRQYDTLGWVMWDAWNYPFNGQTQLNPQRTTGDGRYSFMVPPGSYQVRAIAGGYSPYESGALQVISQPVHLDIAMQRQGGIIYLPVVLKE